MNSLTKYTNEVTNGLSRAKSYLQTYANGGKSPFESFLRKLSIIGAAAFLLYLARELRIRRAKKVLGPKEVVVITGGGSGLGRLMAIKFASKGCKVAIWDVNKQGLEETEKTVKSTGGNIKSYVVDVTDHEKVYEAAKAVSQDLGDCTILINNAGIVSGKNLLELSENQINLTMKVNAISHFWTIRAFLPKMMQNNYGHIVTIASAAGVAGPAGLTDYSASKFAAFGISESIRMELRKNGFSGKRGQGIQNLCVCPYYINTGMFDGVKTRFPLILPILKPEYVINRIINSIERSDSLLMLPSSLYLSFFFRAFFPPSVGDMVSETLGVSDSMNDFKGRQIKH